MKQLTIFLICLFFTQFIEAQTITGKIVKQSDKSLLVMASVELCRAGDSTVLIGTSTNAQGVFHIDNVKKGRYYLLIRNIGFKTLKTEVFDFDGQSTKELKTIELETSEKAVKEVIIKDKNIRVRDELDKTTYYLPDSLLEKTPKISNVITEIPTITYDNFTHKFTVRGKENIMLLVDNKERTIQYINQLPPTAIAKIEIEYFPTGKYSEYDCVINVILNRDKMIGYLAQFNNSSSLCPTYLTTYNNIGLRYTQQNFSINLSPNFAIDNISGKTESKTNFLKNDYSLLQTNKNKFISKKFWIDLDLDWYINKQNTLNIYLSQTPKEDCNSTTNGFNSLSDTTAIDTFTNKYSYRYRRNTSFYSLYYRKTFDKAERNLTFDANYYSYATNTDETYLKQYIYKNNQSFTQSYESALTREDVRQSTYYKLNYEDKIFNDYNFGAGASYNFMTYKNSLANNEIQKKATFKNNQYSGYVTLGGKLRGLSFRLESRVNYYNNYKEDSLVLEKTDIKFSALLRYTTQKVGNFTFQYQHLYNIASTMDINLFKTSLDSLNTKAYTNLSLQPYTSNYLNLYHNLQFDKFSFNSCVFYWIDNQKTDDIVFLNTNKAIETVTINTKNNYLYGIETQINYKNKKWNLNANFKYQQNYHEGIDALAVPTSLKSQYIVGFSARYSVTEKLTLQTLFSHQTPYMVYFQSTWYESEHYILYLSYMFSENANLSLSWYQPFLFKMFNRTELNSNTIQRTTSSTRDFSPLIFVEFQYSIFKGQQRKINRQIEKE